jgi:hypothetical protein
MYYINEANKTLGFLHRNLNISISPDVLDSRYRVGFWDTFCFTNKQIEKIELVQKTVIRFILPDYRQRELVCFTEIIPNLELAPP